MNKRIADIMLIQVMMHIIRLQVEEKIIFRETTKIYPSVISIRKEWQRVRPRVIDIDPQRQKLIIVSLILDKISLNTQICHYQLGSLCN